MMTARELLAYPRWVVVGDVLNQQKYAYQICEALRKEGYRVERVNPRSREPELYRSLGEIPGEIDVIDLVIHPKLGLAILAQAPERVVKGVLMQPGAESEAIVAFCAERQIPVIAGCVLQALDGGSDV